MLVVLEKLLAKCFNKYRFTYQETNRVELLSLGDLVEDFYINGLGEQIPEYSTTSEIERALLWNVVLLAASVPAFLPKEFKSLPESLLSQLNVELSKINSRYDFTSSGYSNFKYEHHDRYAKITALAIIFFFRESADFVGIFEPEDEFYEFTDLLAYMTYDTQLADCFEITPDRKALLKALKSNESENFISKFLHLISDYGETFVQDTPRLKVQLEMTKTLLGTSKTSKNSVVDLILIKSESRIVVDGVSIGFTRAQKRFDGFLFIAMTKECTFSEFKKSGAFKGTAFDESENKNRFARFFRELNITLKKHNLTWDSFIEKTPSGYRMLSHIHVTIR